MILISQHPCSEYINANTWQITSKVSWRTWISIKCLLKGSINLPVFQNYLGSWAICWFSPRCHWRVFSAEARWRTRPCPVQLCLSEQSCRVLKRDRVSTIATVINQCVLPLNQQTTPASQTTWWGKWIISNTLECFCQVMNHENVYHKWLLCQMSLMDTLYLQTY